MPSPDQQPQSDQYIIIIVQCCQNCDTHQSFSRHSQWKYFEQFNQLKRKLERFIANTVVVKNPIPDQLVKPTEARLPPNTYLNRETNQTVVFPRIGAFEIYIFNVLIYSKLLTNAWPNHYKLIQLITKIVEERKKGGNLEEFSVFQVPVQTEDKNEKSANKPSASKKKRKDYRVYKSKEKSTIIQSPIKKKVNNFQLATISLQGQATTRKQGRRTLQQKQGAQLRVSGGVQSTKNENRVKLPSLRKTIDFRQHDQPEQINLRSSLNGNNKSIDKSVDQMGSRQKMQQESLKKIFNSIDEIEKGESSFINRHGDDNKFSSLILQGNQSGDLNAKQQDMRILEDRSVQYSEPQRRDFMNRSIQYEQQQDKYCDFGLQIDDGTLPREINSHFVQTDKIQLRESVEKLQVKPYMLDEQVQANIAIPKDQRQAAAQTVIKQIQQSQTNTETKVTINKGSQFPEEDAKPATKTQFNTIDAAFAHLFEKRRNLFNNNCYSIDKFEQKATKYKWIGRANQQQSLEDIRRKFMLECLVFCFYSYHGVKVAEKRLSYQACSNLVVDQRNSKRPADYALIHVMTADNPEIQLLSQFDQLDDQTMKYPLSQVLTFRASKQRVRFTNYGGFLALAYFLGDEEIFGKEEGYVGVVVSNEEVKQIVKLSSEGYSLPDVNQFHKNKIIVQRGNRQGVISLDRTSQQVEIQFIAMLNKIVDTQTFTQMLKNYQQTFIHMSPTHKTFRDALLSMRTEKLDLTIYEQFIEMLKARRQAIMELYKGEMYSFQRYRSLQPKIVFSLESLRRKADSKEAMEFQRKFMCGDKLVMGGEIEKHIRNKDTFVIVTGESGLGKTTFIQKMSKNLQTKYGDKVKIIHITREILNDQAKIRKKTDQIIDEYRKQVIIIDDAEFYIMQIYLFLQKIYNKQDPRTRPEISFCLTTNADPAKLRVRVTSLGVQIVQCQLLPLQIEQIRGYLMKTIQFQNITDKKNFLDDILGTENIALTTSHPKYHYASLLRNVFYLRLYCSILNNVEDLSDSGQTLLHNFNKYSLLKQAYKLCWSRQVKQCQEMHIKFVDCLDTLRKVAFEYYTNNCLMHENIQQIVNKCTTVDIVANQLAFYPINLQTLLKSNQDLFIHRQFLGYFVMQAYSHYLEKSYRNMSLQKLLRNEDLLALLKQRYQVEKMYWRLLDVVNKSKKYKSTWEQASNAITTLSKISYIFSNYNFDEVEIPDADLSQAVFYNCSFRGANLSNATLYRTQMINCQVENAHMDNINLFLRKYQIDYTVLTASLSQDGRYIAMGCGNYLIILQSDTGKEVKKIQAHMDVIRTVKYSKDNNTLITIADDKTLRMWDTRSYKSVVFKLPQKGTIAFSSQTDMIASVTKSSLKVWNIKSMANEFVLEGHSDLITSLQFSNDGKHIVTGSRDSTIRIWSTKKGQLVRAFKGHNSQIITLKISPGINSIVSSSKDKDIVAWSFDSGVELSRKRLPDEVIEICLDEKEKFVTLALSKQNYILVLHLETMEILHTLQGHKGRIVSLNFDANFRKLVSLGRDKTVKIWDFDRIMECQQKKYYKTNNKQLKQTKGPIICIAYCKLTNTYATAHENGEINIYSAASAHQHRHIDQVVSHNGAVTCLQYDRSGKLYSAGSDGAIKIWQLGLKRQPKILDLHSSEVLQLKLNEKNRLIATSSAAHDLVIVDYTGIKILLTTKQEGRVASIQFSRDERIMAVGGSEKYIAIYVIGEGGSTISRVEELGPNTDQVMGMVFQGDAYLIAALKNGQIAIWNHLKNTLAKKIENNAPVLSLLAFQKRYVCFSADDGKLRVVDMEQGKEVKIFRSTDRCTCMITNSNENAIYEATNNGNVLVWNLETLKQRKEKVQFDRIAFDQQGLKVAQVEGPRQLLIRDLHSHEQSTVKINEINSGIEGVTFYQGKIILLLKNGIHWQLGRKQFNFDSEIQSQGELLYIKNKPSSIFFKTAVRKLKTIRKPVQSVIEDLSY